MNTYKWLQSGQLPLFGTGRWEAMQWREIDPPLIPGEHGLHSCTGEHLARHISDELWFMEVDSSLPVQIDLTQVVAARARITVQNERWNVDTKTRWATACAEHASRFLSMFQYPVVEYQGNWADTEPAIRYAGHVKKFVDYAHEYAERGEARYTVLYARYAAVYAGYAAMPKTASARDVHNAGKASEVEECRWQSSRLLGYLEEGSF